MINDEIVSGLCNAFYDMRSKDRQNFQHFVAIHEQPKKFSEINPYLPYSVKSKLMGVPESSKSVLTSIDGDVQSSIR